MKIDTQCGDVKKQILSPACICNSGYNFCTWFEEKCASSFATLMKPREALMHLLVRRSAPQVLARACVANFDVLASQAMMTLMCHMSAAHVCWSAGVRETVQAFLERKCIPFHPIVYSLGFGTKKRSSLSVCPDRFFLDSHCHARKWQWYQ